MFHTAKKNACLLGFGATIPSKGSLAHDGSIYLTDLNRKGRAYSLAAVNKQDWRRNEKEKKRSLLLICGIQFKLRS